MRLTIENAFQLIKQIATSNSCWIIDTIPKKPSKVNEVDKMTMVNTKLNALTKKLEMMDMKVVNDIMQFEICRKGHASKNCNTINAYPGEQSLEQAKTINFNQGS